MLHLSPILPDPLGSDLTLSILAALGLEEAVVEIASPGAEKVEEVAVNAVPVDVDWMAADPAMMPAATSMAPALIEQSTGNVTESLGVPATVGEIEASASDRIVDFVIVEVERSTAQVVIQVETETPSLAPAVTEFHTESFSLMPAAPAFESVASDAAAAARGGAGGGGGGGAGGGVVTEYLSGSANGTAGYDIQIKFLGTGWTQTLQGAFKNAADYFTKVITDDIGGGGRIGSVIVDDLYVTAEVKQMDGTGGILGQAGPSHVWTANELTADGSMQFDVADAVNYQKLGLWDDIVTHELMHVLGFGSLWNYGNNPLVSGDKYLGANAVAAYDQAFGTTQSYILVETDGGSGTAGSHWDEQALVNELMTGYINTDGNSQTINDNYLSKFSVMSLADLGYKVAYQDYSYDGTPTLPA